MNAKMNALTKEELAPNSPSPIAVAEMQLKRILCATDFSPCSRKALLYAVSLSRQFGAEIILVHVYEPAPPQVGVLEGALAETDLYTDLAKQLEHWREDLPPDLKSSAAMRQGTPAREIVDAAAENNIDLIVVGNHGRTGLARVVLGSTAEKVVRLAPCPVLVVREHEHEFIKV